MIASADTVELTDTQGRVLQAISDHITAHRYAPSMREIASAAGLASPSTVLYHLGRLEALGLIRRDAGLPRALVLLGRESDPVAAGGSGAL